VPELLRFLAGWAMPCLKVQNTGQCVALLAFVQAAWQRCLSSASPTNQHEQGASDTPHSCKARSSWFLALVSGEAFHIDGSTVARQSGRPGAGSRPSVHG